MSEKHNSPFAGFAAVFSVACVLFGSHAGGGFATGNQATQYFVSVGWTAPLIAIGAMAVLSLTVRECIIMYNSRGLTSYKELFQTLYHPFDKIEWLFEVYFFIMVIMAVSAVIAGAASLFQEGVGIPYFAGVLVTGVILLALTIFGASLVSKASTVMSVCILSCCVVIFVLGIAAKGANIMQAVTAFDTPGNWKKSILNVFTYAGFQSVVIPTMIKCGTPLKTDKNAGRAMTIAFLLNSVALVLSVLMLVGWYGDYQAAFSAGNTSVPSLYICEQLHMPFLFWFYNIALFLCFISTGVTTIYGFVSRFEHIKVLSGIKNTIARRAIVSALVMTVSMTVSSVGLTNIIKYGYGYCGYLGIAIIIIPFLTAGVYKNRKYLKEQEKRADKKNYSMEKGLEVL